MIEDILEMSGLTGGITSVWYEDLTTKRVVSRNEQVPLVAASVIKLFIMAEAFRQFEAGTLDPDQRFTIRPEDKMPSCGALTYMHDGLEVTCLDLVTLMIILSDNTATNLLIDRLGMEGVNQMCQAVGGEGCRLNRKLFDAQAASRGIENTITAAGVGNFLHGLYHGELVSENASKQMLSILKNQRLNGKIPFFLDLPIAHKTGEDEGITHDAAIVFAPKPFILVMLSNKTNVPKFERLMQDAARDLAGAAC